MLTFIVGAFVVLHGLVHLLYFAQSRRLLELRPDLRWPDGSWAFSRLLGDETTRQLASVACLVAAGSFVAGGAGLLLGQDWWRALVVGAAAFSAVIIALLWNGTRRRLSDQGGIGLLIDLALVVALLIQR